MPEPLSPLGGGRRVRRGKGSHRGQTGGTGSWKHPCGGLRSAVLHLHPPCVCRQSPRPSLLGRGSWRPVKSLGQGESRVSRAPLRWETAFGGLLGGMVLHHLGKEVPGKGWRESESVCVCFGAGGWVRCALFHRSGLCQWLREARPLLGRSLFES